MSEEQATREEILADVSRGIRLTLSEIQVALREGARPLAWMAVLVALAAFVTTAVEAARRPGSGISYGWSSARIALTTDVPADGSGLRAGDKFVRIDDRFNPDIAEVDAVLGALPGGQAFEVEVIRPGTGTLTKSFSLSGPTSASSWLAPIPTHAIVAILLPGAPAWNAGIRPDDVIVSVDGRPLSRPEHLDATTRLGFKALGTAELIAALPGIHATEIEAAHEGTDRLRFGVWRGNNEQTIDVAPGTRGVDHDDVAAVTETVVVVFIVFALAMRMAAGAGGVVKSGIACATAVIWWVLLLNAFSLRIGEQRDVMTVLRDAGPLIAFVGVRWAADSHRVYFRPPVGFSVLVASFLAWAVWTLQASDVFDPEAVRRSAASLDWMMQLRLKVFEPGQPPLLPLLMLWCFIAGLTHLLVVFCFGVLPLSVVDRGIRAVDGTGGAGPGAPRPEVVYGVHAHLAGRFETACARTADFEGRRGALEKILDDVDDEHAHDMSLVRWTEQALPLLGFLGTVIGIAAALLTLSAVLTQVVVFDDQGRLTETVRSAMDKAFNELGFAFDTTFVGLAGVLIIGGFDLLVRRSYVAGLARTRDLLEGELAAVGGTTSSNELRMLQGQVAALQHAVDVQLVEVQTVKQNAGRSLMHLVLEGEEAPFVEMRRVLYRTLVRVDDVTLGNPPARATTLATAIGKPWRHTAIGVPPSTAAAAVLTAEGPNGCAIVVIPPRGQRDDRVVRVRGVKNVVEAIPAHDLGACFLRTQDGRSIIVDLARGEPTGRGTPTPGDAVSFALPAADRTLVVQVALAAGPLVVRRFDLSSGMVEERRIANGTRWMHAAFHREGARSTLFAVDQADGAVTILRIPMTSHDGKAIALDALEPEPLFLKDVVAHAVAAVGGNELVVFGPRGRVDHVSWDRAPVALDWRAGAPEAVVAGRGPWFVVVANGKLHVRRVSYGGNALLAAPDPYVDFPIGTKVFMPGGWRLTDDGGLILAYRAEDIAAWSFPQTTL